MPKQKQKDIRVPFNLIQPVVDSFGVSVGGLDDEELQPQRNVIAVSERAPQEVQPIRSILGDQQENPNLVGKIPNISTSPKMNIGEVQQPTDRLREMLSNPPLRADYEPRKLRKFGAALAGGLTGAAFGPKTGMETAQGIAEQPFRNAYQDWVTQTGALKSQEELDLNRQKAFTSGLSDYASLIRAQFETDPRAKGAVAGAEETAKYGAREPYEIRKETRELSGRKAIEELQRELAVDIENIRQSGQTLREGMQTARAAEDRKSREAEGAANRRSREGIAAAGRAIREKVANEAKKGITINAETEARTFALATLAQSPTYRKLFDFAPNGSITRKDLKGDKALELLSDELDDDIADLVFEIVNSAKNR